MSLRFKEIFALNLRTNDFFGKFFVQNSVNLTLIWFQMWFLDSLKRLQQKPSRRRKKQSMYLDITLNEERFFRVCFCFRSCSNVYLFSRLVFQVKQICSQKVNRIQKTYWSSSMWFWPRTATSKNKRPLQNVFSFSELLDVCLSVSKYDFEIAELCAILLVDGQGVKALFPSDFANRMTFSVSIFCFRRRPFNADLFSNVVFERAKTISSSFTWNKENLHVNYGGGILQNVVFFSKLLDERLLFFESGTQVRADWSADVELIRRYKTTVD